MDKTKEYILKCEKAVKIQEIFFKSISDFRKYLPSFVFDKGMDRVSIIIWTPETIREIINSPKNEPYITVSIEQDRDKGFHREHDQTKKYQEIAIWLPTQSQLQEMCIEKDLRHLAKEFVFFTFVTRGISMEQFWLAFVMKEKYGKTWNGEDWVK